LRSTLSIFFAVWILVMPLMKWSAFLMYELNKDYYASVLCEKKEIPDNCCAGSCYLEKQLEQAEKQEKKLPAAFREHAETFFTIPTFRFSFFNPLFVCAAKRAEVFFNYVMICPHFSPAEIFHPPCL
jgi:hypothetical protein